MPLFRLDWDGSAQNMPPGALSESRARRRTSMIRLGWNAPAQKHAARWPLRKPRSSRSGLAPSALERPRPKPEAPDSLIEMRPFTDAPVRPLLARQRPSSPPLDASADSGAPDTPSSAPAFPSPHRVASPLPPPSDIAANSRCRQPAPAPPVFRDAHLSTKQRWPSDRSSARRAPYRSAHQLRRPERPSYTVRAVMAS